MLEISDLESRGIVLCCENKGADQLHGYLAADLRFVFTYAKSRFSHDMTQFVLYLQDIIPLG